MFSRFLWRIALLVLVLWGGFGAPQMALAQVPEANGEASPDQSIPADEAVSRLLEVLRDETARTALIERLEAEAAPTDSATAEPETLAQRIAAFTADTAENLAGQFSRIGVEFTRLRFLVRQMTSADAGSYRGELLALALTILSTIAVYRLLDFGISRIARRLDPHIGAGFRQRARGAGLLVLIRIGIVALAWLVGYALAVLVFGVSGEPSTAQSLYLNAFALFGLSRAVVRLFASPKADDEPVLSLLAPGAQAIIYRSLRAVLVVLIQGLLFLVPLTQAWAGFAAARPLRTLVVTVAALTALLAIRRISKALKKVRGAGTGHRDGQGKVMAEGAYSVWRRIWPPLVAAYVLYAWFVAISRPNMLEEVVLGGTLYSAASFALLLLALWLLRTAPDLRAPIPRPLIAAVPRLGPRADALMTAVGWAVAIIMVLAAIALVLGGWGWIDLPQVLSDPATQRVLWSIASAALVALMASIIWAIVASWIDHRLKQDLSGSNASARSRTLLALFRNAFTIAIAILATMITLSQLGIDIAPLIAGAGVIGLAIGFGSQKLVQDIITGIFIQLENAMNEGDVVGVAGITGGVEKITIRSVRLRTLDGAAHVIPFSSVDTVTNLTRDFSYHLAEIGAAYKEKVSDIKDAMEEAFARLRSEPFDADILEPLEMQGVTQLGDSAVVVRARIKTLPGKQFALGRRYTELVKEVMDERGLEIPFPHRQLIFPERFQLPKPDEGKAAEPSEGTKTT